MPEGNEVHRFAKLHTATFVGKTICVESPNGRFTGAALLTGRKLNLVIAYGKAPGLHWPGDRKPYPLWPLRYDFIEGKMPSAVAYPCMRWSNGI